ncbi:MAG: hypothetical protein AB1746_05605 [Candidatus Zixiibacteriota bacterium]
MTYNQRIEFWDERYGSGVDGQAMVSRPSLIILNWIKHLKKTKKLSWEEAVNAFGKESKIPAKDIQRISEGFLPSSYEINKISQNCGWSLFFLFGISEKAYKLRERMFFYEIGISTPTSSDRLAFKELYEECLLQISLDEGR